jgi:hypothetical protein
MYVFAEGDKGDILGVITELMPTVVSGEGSCFEKCIELWCLTKSAVLRLHAVSQ